MPTRRQFLRTTALGLGVAAAAPLTRGAPAPKPNIIFILADDLGYSDLSCYGQTHWQTPNIDRLAAEGMRFTQHYAGSTVCAPSRCALLTGRHMGHAYVRTNGSFTVRPDPEDLTVATLLKRAGYRTAMIGKSGLGCNSNDGAFPNTKGFDHFFGFVSHGAAHDYFPRKLFRNGEALEFPGNSRHEGDTYSHDLFLKETMTFLDSAKDGPFFLHCAAQIPHASLYAPARWREPFRGTFENEKPVSNQRHYRNDPEPKATYAGMVARLDWEVGQIVARLKQLGIAENTLILFASDNGSMNEGGYQRAWFNSSGPLRGGKRDLYEGGIRTPFIAHWPGTIGAATSSDHISAFWDFLPTACELAGVPVPDDTDGISYLPALLGRNEDQKPHEYLYWEFYEQGVKRAVRFGRWKAVQTNVRRAPNGPIELYDLEQDLGERTDIAAKHPEVVAKARALLLAAHVPNNRSRMPEAPPPPEPKPLEGLLPKTDWKLVRVDSENVVGKRLGIHAIDGNPDSWWHTQWQGAKPPHPHELVVDLGAVCTIAALRLRPRSDKTMNGVIGRYEFFVGRAPDNFGKPVSAGKMTMGDPAKVARFPAARGQFVMLRALSALNGTPYTSLAELDLVGTVD